MRRNRNDTRNASARPRRLQSGEIIRLLLYFYPSAFYSLFTGKNELSDAANRDQGIVLIILGILYIFIPPTMYMYESCRFYIENRGPQRLTNQQNPEGVHEESSEALVNLDA